MHNNFEKSIKEKIESYEAPYDANAWNSISKKLDAKQIARKKWNQSRNWIVLSAVVIASSTLYFSTIEESNQSSSVAKKTTSSEKSQIESQDSPKTKTAPQPIEEVEKETVKVLQSTKVEKNTKQSNFKIDQIKLEKSKEFQLNTKITNCSFTAKNKQITEGNTLHETNEFIPIKYLTSYCQNESVIFENINNFPIFLHSNGTTKTLPANEKTRIKLSEIGGYYWSKENKSARKNSDFNVHEAPISIFSLTDGLDFSNGLPELITESIEDAKILKWFVNDKEYSKNKEVKITLFQKGISEIKLYVENEFGCYSSLTKSFDVEENYNLISATGIDPSHPDRKRSTFLPYALKVRDTPFRMLIIDPRTGEVIFETNDSSKPWDGTNQKTNQLVPENTEYIWKVFLQKPEKGEKSEYHGKITRI
jgi:hypothetical protein